MRWEKPSEWQLVNIDLLPKCQLHLLQSTPNPPSTIPPLPPTPIHFIKFGFIYKRVWLFGSLTAFSHMYWKKKNISLKSEYPVKTKQNHFQNHRFSSCWNFFFTWGRSMWQLQVTHKVHIYIIKKFNKLCTCFRVHRIKTGLRVLPTAVDRQCWDKIRLVSASLVNKVMYSKQYVDNTLILFI